MQSSKYPLTIWRTQFTALLGTLSVFRNMGLFLGLAVKSRVPICHLLEPLQAPAGPMQNVTTGSVFCTIKLVSKAGAIHSTAPGTVWACFWDHNSNKWFSYFQYTFKPFLPLLQSAEPCYTQCTKLHQEYQIFVSTTKISLSIYCFQSNLYFVFTQLSASFKGRLASSFTFCLFKVVMHFKLIIIVQKSE